MSGDESSQYIKLQTEDRRTNCAALEANHAVSATSHFLMTGIQ